MSDDETQKGFLVFSRKLLCEELFGDDIDFMLSILGVSRHPPSAISPRP